MILCLVLMVIPMAQGRVLLLRHLPTKASNLPESRIRIMAVALMAHSLEIISPFR